MTRAGRDLKFLTVVDEYSRECLAILTKRSLKSFDMLNTLADLFLDVKSHIVMGRLAMKDFRILIPCFNDEFVRG